MLMSDAMVITRLPLVMPSPMATFRKKYVDLFIDYIFHPKLFPYLSLNNFDPVLLLFYKNYKLEIRGIVLKLNIHKTPVLPLPFPSRLIIMKS